jgi:hypothetical protein
MLIYMGLLVYSDKCKHCAVIIDYIKTQPALLKIVRFHNITTHGNPSKKITMVPTLVTDEGVMKTGQEVRVYLESMIPVEFDGITMSEFGANLDDSDDSNNLFEISQYGQSLQPIVTKEMEEKMSMSIADAVLKAS